jgi:hypothetical protein
MARPVGYLKRYEDKQRTLSARVHFRQRSTDRDQGNVIAAAHRGERKHARPRVVEIRNQGKIHPALSASTRRSEMLAKVNENHHSKAKSSERSSRQDFGARKKKMLKSARFTRPHGSIDEATPAP